MIKHIVMFKLKHHSKENIQKVVKALKTLEGNIEVLRSAEIGINITVSERSYDIALTTEFDNRDALNSYGQHPKHLPVVDIVRSHCSESVVVDYEI